MEKISKNRQILTEGNIASKLVVFALPFLISNVLQYLYNSVDALMVEMVVGSNAYNGVMQSGKVSQVLVSFFMGISAGAGVVVSQYFGAKDKQNLRKAVHSTILLGLISGVILSVVGLLISRSVLKLIGTQPTDFAYAAQYLKVYFLGVVFLVIYNMGSGILRAVGDTVTPLIFLAVTAVLNIVLNYFMIPRLGIVGAALATIIAQGVSAVLVMIRLFTAKADYRVRLKELKPDLNMFKKIFKVGLPTGVQHSVISMAHLVMTGFINQFSSPEITGTYHYNMIDGFIYLPFNSFAISLSTFVGQNAGASRYDRVKKSIKTCLLICMGMTIVLGALMLLFGKHILLLFEQKPTNLVQGATMSRFIIAADQELMHATSLKYMRVLVFSYPILVVNDTLAGAIRGAGQALVPAIITTSSMCVLRVIFLFAFMPIISDIIVVYLSYTITWFMSAIALTLYYFKGNWKKSVLVEQTPSVEVECI